MAITSNASKTTTFEAASYLEDRDTVAEYLDQAFATGEADLINAVLGDVARANEAPKAVEKGRGV